MHSPEQEQEQQRPAQLCTTAGAGDASSFKKYKLFGQPSEAFPWSVMLRLHTAQVEVSMSMCHIETDDVAFDISEATLPCVEGRYLIIGKSGSRKRCEQPRTCWIWQPEINALSYSHSQMHTAAFCRDHDLRLCCAVALKLCYACVCKLSTYYTVMADFSDVSLR